MEAIIYKIRPKKEELLLLLFFLTLPKSLWCSGQFDFDPATSMAKGKSLGKVIQGLGDIQRKKNGQKSFEKMRPGEDLFMGDHLETGPNSYLKLSFLKEAVFDLGEKTQISLIKRGKKNEGKDKVTSLRLLKGKARLTFSKSNKQSSEEKIMIETANTSIEVNGPLELLIDILQKNKQDYERILILEGKAPMALTQREKKEGKEDNGGPKEKTSFLLGENKLLLMQKMIEEKKSFLEAQVALSDPFVTYFQNKVSDPFKERRVFLHYPFSQRALTGKGPLMVNPLGRTMASEKELWGQGHFEQDKKREGKTLKENLRSLNKKNQRFEKAKRDDSQNETLT